jgi:hypothetical protein
MEPPADPARHRAMRTLHAPVFCPPAVVAALLVIAWSIAACSPGTGASTNPGSSPGTSPGATPGTTQSPVETAEAAADRVAVQSPLFDGIEARDADLIGQANWWEAVPLDEANPPTGWRVTFRVGWGDCPSGCIDEHTWVYDVTRDGTVRFVSEAGGAVPQEVIDGLLAASDATGVAGRVTAGPTCPVETPDDPTCNPRPVAGAVLVVKGAGGVEVARITTDATGLFRIGLQPGDYTLEPQPAEGLMGTPSPLPFRVVDGDETFLDVEYDTGIR